MADEKSPDQGAANMDGALSGAGGLSDINKEQLAHLGGTLDPIDTEDFSDADFGNVLPDDFDPKAPPVDTKTDADAEDDADEADDKDKESDDDAEADADKDSDDAEETGHSDHGVAYTVGAGENELVKRTGKRRAEHHACCAG